MAALICISCDSPAMRKVGGFMSHNTQKGCSKCTKDFPTASFGPLVCFKPVLSDTEHSMWVVFVKACSLLCSQVITQCYYTCR